PVAIREFDLVATCITSAIADAVGEYVRARQRESELPFQLFVASVKDYAIYMLDPTGHVASWNAGAERIKGYTREEILGSHFSKFYPTEDIAAGKPQRELDEALARGRYEETGWRIKKDGSRFMADVTITPVHDTDGQ